MMKNRQVNHFFLTDKPRNRKYKFSYDKDFSLEEKLKWRERWTRGEIELECGCGKPFAINRGGAIYYPVREGEPETKPHAKHCSRGKSGVMTGENKGQKKDRWIVLRLPPIPNQPNEKVQAVDEERKLAERLVEPYPMTRTESLKTKTGRKWVEVNGKEAHMNSLLVETIPELKGKTPEEDHLLLIRPIASIEEERYGFVKVNLLDAEGKLFPVFIRGEMMRAMMKQSELAPADLPAGKDLTDRFWLSGIGYIREEKWKNGMFRKTYLIRGGLLQVRWT